jgi:hypothetical protein
VTVRHLDGRSLCNMILIELVFNDASIIEGGVNRLGLEIADRSPSEANKLVHITDGDRP